MKIFNSQRGLFLFGLILLLAINGVVLGGIAVNRSGTPEAQVVLTERELELPYQLEKEDSGLAFRLDWRVVGDGDSGGYYASWDVPVWFDEAKLQQLGFVLPVIDESDDYDRSRRSSSEKEVFIVLEVDSPLFAKVITGLEGKLARERSRYALDGTDRDRVIKAEKRIQEEQRSGSRLFAIDAGLDAVQLRQLYSDRAKYIITKGVVNHRWNYGVDNKKKESRGYIVKLSNNSIHVSRKYRLELDTIVAGKFSRNGSGKAPRFQVELAYGSRLEPWIVAVQNILN